MKKSVCGTVNVSFFYSLNYHSVWISLYFVVEHFCTVYLWSMECGIVHFLNQSVLEVCPPFFLCWIKLKGLDWMKFFYDFLRRFTFLGLIFWIIKITKVVYKCLFAGILIQDIAFSWKKGCRLAVELQLWGLFSSNPFGKREWRFLPRVLVSVFHRIKLELSLSVLADHLLKEAWSLGNLQPLFLFLYPRLEVRL